MRFFAVVGLMTLIMGVKAAEMLIPPENLFLRQPSGKYHLQSVVSCDGNRIRLGKISGLEIRTTFCIPKLTSREQILQFSGRSFSPESSATLRIVAFFLHSREEESCLGISDEKGNNFSFQFQLPADRIGTVKFPFLLQPGAVKCAQCGKPLTHCHVGFFLSINPIPKNYNPDQWGFELSDIRFVSASFANLQEKQKDGLLIQSIAEERKFFARWQEKHRAVLGNYPDDNHFDASRVPGEITSGPSSNMDYRYFTEAELQQLNPQFKVKKLASWEFYRENVFCKIASPNRTLEDVDTVFLRHGVIYACLPDRVVRWNPENESWDYLLDQWTHRPVKQFPDAAGQLHIVNHKAYRLSDYSEVELPRRTPFQYAVAGDRTFWIAPGRKDLFGGESDFSHPRLMELSLPSVPRARTVELRNIYECGSNDRLLLECTAFFPNNNVPLLLELDLETKTLKPKLPIIEDYYFLQKKENNWCFSSDAGDLYDVGKGRPLMALQGETERPVTAKLMPPRLGIGPAHADFLKQALRWGVYAVTGNYPGNDLVLLNLFSPEKSLRIYGLEQRHNLLLNEDSTALLAIMPDGLYEIRALEMPEVPSIKMPEISAATPPSESAAVVTEIEADAPVLFDAEKKQGKIIFTSHPTAAKTSIVLHLKLSPQHRHYLVRFDQNVSRFLDCIPENAEEEQDSSIWINSRTLRIRSDTVKLSIELSPQEKSRQVVLEDILPDNNKNRRM